MCVMRAPEIANAVISSSKSAKQKKVKYLHWPSNWQCDFQPLGKHPSLPAEIYLKTQRER